MPYWYRAVPGYGFVAGMYAFGLEESGEYEKAETYIREAVELNPRDGWAVHAVTHVMEMQDRVREGIEYLNSLVEGWAPSSMFAFHLWWHQALFLLEAHDVSGMLRHYDEHIAAGGFGQTLELVDGSSLLWRLFLLGHDAGPRWAPLADQWEARAGDAYYAFNDMNAMMAFVGAGREQAQRTLLAAARRAAAGSGTNAMMSHEVGVPVCEGIAAFGRGDYAGAIEWLLPLRGKSCRMGGSHAQRDVLSWTLTEAAIRLGDHALAAATVAERQAWKPRSPLNRAWAIRAAQLQSQAASHRGIARI